MNRKKFALRAESHVQPPPPLDLRPSLAEIWGDTRFNSKQCADLAKVNEEVILIMFRSVPVDPAEAMKVLDALSQMYPGRNYSLETVKVELIKQ